MVGLRTSYCTCGGTVAGGVVWTFGGTVGFVGESIVGVIELTRHKGEEAIKYRSDDFIFLGFAGPSVTGPHNTAVLSGRFTNTRDTRSVMLTFIMVAKGEPYARAHLIGVKAGSVDSWRGDVWIGTASRSAFPYVLPTPITEGDILVHDIEPGLDLADRPASVEEIRKIRADIAQSREKIDDLLSNMKEPRKPVNATPARMRQAERAVGVSLSRIEGHEKILEAFTKSSGGVGRG